MAKLKRNPQMTAQLKAARPAPPAEKTLSANDLLLRLKAIREKKQKVMQMFSVLTGSEQTIIEMLKSMSAPIPAVPAPPKPEG